MRLLSEENSALCRIFFGRFHKNDFHVSRGHFEGNDLFLRRKKRCQSNVSRTLTEEILAVYSVRLLTMHSMYLYEQFERNAFFSNFFCFSSISDIER